MSIDIRYITNGAKSGYYVKNTAVTPIAVEFYSKKFRKVFGIMHRIEECRHIGDLTWQE